MRQVRVLAVLALSAVSVLAGCSTGEPPVAAPPTTVTPSATLPPPPPGTGAPNGELVLGTLLPRTGDLSALGPPEAAGVALAMKDINAAGGVLGKPVRTVVADSGDTASNIAAASVDSLFVAKADAIIGAASSSVSLTVLEKITSAGVLQVSPANTSAELSSATDDGLYFRTAPSDVLQAGVLANQVNDDKASSLSVLAIDEPYGIGMADRLERVFRQVGGDVKDRVTYPRDAQVFSDQVGKVVSENPEAVVLIGFREAEKIVPELVRQGIGPSVKKIYFVDGNLSNTYTLPADTLTGIKGTLPGARASKAFQARMTQQDAKLDNFSYGPEAYDAAVLIALGVVAARTDAGAPIAQQLVALSRDGEKCTDFATCKSLVEAGKDVDYDGQSGPIEFDSRGDPARAPIGVYVYGPDNAFGFTKTVIGSLE